MAVAENNNYCDFVDDYLDTEMGQITGQIISSGSTNLFNDDDKLKTNPINFRIHKQNELEEKPITNGQIIPNDQDDWMAEKSVYQVIPNQEVVEGEHMIDLEASSDAAADEEDLQQVDHLPPQGIDECMTLRKREYRTARQMALMETQITRRTSTL